MTTIRNVESKYWEDVKEGDVLPSITLPVTITLCALDAASTRDYFPGHHDREFARGQGVRDAYLNTMFLHGFVDRIGSDWVGPDAWLAKRKLRMVSSVCVGDIIQTEAGVVAKYKEGNRHLIDIDVRLVTQHSVGTRASLTYLMPTRESSAA